MRPPRIAVTWSLVAATPIALAACSESAPSPSSSSADVTPVRTTEPAGTAAPAEPVEPETTAAAPQTPAAAPPQSQPAGIAVDLANLPGASFTGELITTDSGLQYVDIVAGEGVQPAASDVAVQVHYTGWLPDGTKFDSSHDRGEPADFVLASVIGGWTEGVGSMAVGGTRKLVIPGDLAYGPGGNPRAGIGPNQTLVFDVELLAIDPWAGMPDPPPGDPVEGEPVVTESKARYWVVGEGSGEPAAADAVTAVNFKLYRPDGKLIFDSASGGKPLDIFSDSMFPGWRETMAGMRVGERRKLMIPWEVGFGPRGDPRLGVPPRATTIFDVELVGIDRWSSMPEELPGEPVEGEPVVLESGLQYHDIVVGEGQAPSGPTAVVKVHYTGWLNDGEQFDSSYTNNMPAEFALNGVIKGWTEGVGSMRVGGTRKLIVPYDMAYGPRGRSSIPPKALLVFDVELLEIVNE